MYSAAIPRLDSPVAVLQDPRDIPVGERDIRVEDYLNDKIQTAADLKDLEALIAKVEEQKRILQTQVGCIHIFVDVELTPASSYKMCEQSSLKLSMPVLTKCRRGSGRPKNSKGRWRV
jgi:hypothetical protein